MKAATHAAAWLWTLAVGAAGCLDAADRGGGALSTDSAGVTIVDHGRIHFESLPRWTLSARPHASVGTVMGTAEYQFDRIQDARRLHDGAIVVVDRSRSLRLFDSDGRHVWTAGRAGDGPGEFRAPYIVRGLEPDSIVVWDAGPNRLTVFSSDGQLARTATLQGVSGNAAAWGMSGPRSFLIEFRRAERTTINGHAALVHPSDFYLVDLDAEITRELGRRPYVTNFQEVDENGGFSPAIFATSAVIAPAPSGLWYGDAKEAELRQEIGPHQPRRIVRWAAPDRAVSDSEVEALIATWQGESESDPTVLRHLDAYGRTHPRAERFPPYERILVDRIGRLWVQDFVKEHEDDGRRHWTVFSADGTRTLARMTHRAAIEPRDIGSQWILVVERDELGVETLHVYALETGS